MNIEHLTAMAARIYADKGWQPNEASTRNDRNEWWAYAIGCAYHGHSRYNDRPDAQWHIKRADANRPQSDDVTAHLDDRDAWDCIQGAGGPHPTFRAMYLGTLPPEQIIYAPPVPFDARVPPVPPPVPGAATYIVTGTMREAADGRQELALIFTPGDTP